MAGAVLENEVNRCQPCAYEQCAAPRRASPAPAPTAGKNSGCAKHFHTESDPLTWGREQHMYKIMPSQYFFLLHESEKP